MFDGIFYIAGLWILSAYHFTCITNVLAMGSCDVRTVWTENLQHLSMTSCDVHTVLTENLHHLAMGSCDVRTVWTENLHHLAMGSCDVRTVTRRVTVA